MPKPGKIRDMKKKIQVRAREVLQHGVSNSVWVHSSGRGEVGCIHQKFSGGEWRAERAMILLSNGGPGKLKQVASG